MPDRRTPLELADERETLLQFLDYLRESVVIKARGLDAEMAHRSLVPSGTSLLGLVKHLTTAEMLWFQHAFAGLDVSVAPDGIGPDDTVESAVAAYRETCRTNNEIVAGCSDLEQLCQRAISTPEPLSLRWVLVHMVEETARHAGHADIIRELIDGTTGR